jgi:hypothetical protein
MSAGNAGVFYIQVNRCISTFGQESNATPQSRNKLVHQRSLHPGVGLRWHDTLRQQLQPLSPETTMSTILPLFSVKNKHEPRICCSHRAIATEHLNKMFLFSWRSRKYISALHKSWKLADKLKWLIHFSFIRPMVSSSWINKNINCPERVVAISLHPVSTQEILRWKDCW